MHQVDLPLVTQQHDGMRTNRRITHRDSSLQVIAFLNGPKDAGTIANCSLVCRAWLDFSRSKLHLEVKLNYRHQWIAFDKIIQDPTAVVQRHLGVMRKITVSPIDAHCMVSQRDCTTLSWTDTTMGSPQSLPMCGRFSRSRHNLLSRG